MAPLLAGVFAGDRDRLSIAEQRSLSSWSTKGAGSSLTGGTLNAGPGLPSLLRGLLAARKAPAPPSPFVSLSGGLEALVTRLAERLPPGTVKLRQARVAHLRPAADGISVEARGR